MLELSGSRRHFDREGDVRRILTDSRASSRDSGVEEITGIIIMDRRPGLPDKAENSKTPSLTNILIKAPGASRLLNHVFDPGTQERRLRIASSGDSF